MMKFSNVFLEYTKFMKENSKYNLDITKDYIVGTTHFPTIEFKYEDSANTKNATHGMIEYYDKEYFSITIYAQDLGNISKNIISEELIELTHIFMGKILGLTRTSCKPIPNLDTTVLRTLMKYECYYGNVYGNIIRR